MNTMQLYALDIATIRRQAPIAESEYHASIGSTNDRALELAKDDATPLPYLIASAEQTAGRGRGGNSWWTGRGSLAFSLLVGNDWFGNLPPVSRPMMSLAVGLAVVEAVRPLAAGLDMGIHWPNDVMLGGRKLAGILIESPRADRMVIGVGLNVNNSLAEAPTDVRKELQERATTLLDATGRVHDPTRLLIELLSAMKREIDLLAESAEKTAERVHGMCVQRGTMVEVRQGDGVARGLCVGVAATGALLMETPGGIRQVWSVGNI